MNFTEKEILIAGELKSLGLPWNPREGDYCTDGEHDVYLVTRSLAEELRRDPAASGRTWLPRWDQIRDALRTLGYRLEEHAESSALDRYAPFDSGVGMAVRSTHRGRFTSEGDTDLEAAYTVLYKVLKAEKAHKEPHRRSVRIQGKLCPLCQGIMRLKETGGSWHYVCPACHPDTA